MGRWLLVVGLVLSACHSDPLTVPLDLSVIGCAATVTGASMRELGGPQAARATASPPGNAVGFGCYGIDQPGLIAASIGFLAPAQAMHFVAHAQYAVYSPTPGYFNGDCSGDVVTDGGAVGDRFRGTFSCPLLKALAGTVTDPSLSVTISDGAFDVQISAPAF